MRRITLRLGDSSQGLEIPNGKTIEEIAAQFMEITPAVQQAINTQFGTPQARAAEALETDIIPQINAFIAETNTPIVLPGTAAAALPVIQTALNAMLLREKKMLQLLRKMVKDELEE